MKKNITKWILALGIIIILNIFFAVGVNTFYSQPQYEDFCNEKIRTSSYTTEDGCKEAGGLWSGAQDIRKPVPVTPAYNEGESGGWCNVYYSCEKEYREVKEFYDRNVFLILVVLGVAAIVLGFALAEFEAVSLGFMLGGILSVVIATLQFWSLIEDYLRLIIVGMALLVLIWIGIKKIGKTGKDEQN